MLGSGVLYRQVIPSKKDRNAVQLVIPQGYHKKALQGCHDDIRHMGVEWMLDLLRDQFYWPGVTKDAELHIAKCEQCIHFKSRLQKVEIENIWATYPLQLVHLDFLTIEMTEGGKNIHILIITDHFTRYAQALVTSSQTAMCRALTIWDQFIVHYNLPKGIISDQGQNLKSDLISELCQLARVWKLHTSPYNPQTNGQCEWFYSTLINMLGTLLPNKKCSWRDVVPMLVHVYNCIRSTATGFRPYYLMHGQKPLLPVDLYCGTQKADISATTAKQVTEKENQRNKCNYDHRIRCTQLRVGDQILLKKTAFKCKYKIEDVILYFLIYRT